MKLSTFNPSKHSYAFRLKGYCFALKNNGVCSLKLTEEQAAKEYDKEKTNKPIRYKEESVLYCRKLAQFLLSKNYYNNASKDPFPITMYENSCGHYTFADGQHRTCIAKQLDIKSIMVNYHVNGDFVCPVCSSRGTKKPRWQDRFKVFTKKEIPRTIIDDEWLYK